MGDQQTTADSSSDSTLEEATQEEVDAAMEDVEQTEENADDILIA
ncbi:hypothetical protein [Natrarchaeobius chitinivorans]|nr:hypothetical protein [Natrarchaeobius chitinivorans]